jgi:hypothetical protein
MGTCLFLVVYCAVYEETLDIVLYKVYGVRYTSCMFTIDIRTTTNSPGINGTLLEIRVAKYKNKSVSSDLITFEREPVYDKTANIIIDGLHEDDQAVKAKAFDQLVAMLMDTSNA